VDLYEHETRQLDVRLIPNRVPLGHAGSARNNQALVSVEELAVPGRARQEFAKAYRRYRKQDLDGALKHQLRGLDVAPSFVPAHNQLAFYYLQLGELDKAQESLEAALHLDPKQLMSYLGLAEVLAEKKEFLQAGQVLLQANKSHPDRGEPYYVAAQIYYRQGNLDYAEQSGQLALEHDHAAIPEAHLLLVKIYRRRQMPDKLADHLEAYLAEAPRGQHAEQARAHLKRVRLEQARTSP
jgi:tetratricopeptide (TPR) repeat protein